MARIVYEGADGIKDTRVIREELELDSAGVHWSFPVDEDPDGRTISKLVPCERVYHVEKLAPLAWSVGDWGRRGDQSAVNPALSVSMPSMGHRSKE